jgi:hypothetical protein
MNKFDQYMKRLEVTELVTESSNTFTYSLPEDRNKRLFDFYTFSSLSPLIDKIEKPELGVQKSLTNPDNVNIYGSRKLNTNFIDSFWNAHDKCYVELAKEMLNDIFFCLASEFTHIDQDSNHKDVENKIPENLNRDLYKDYVNKNLDNTLSVPPKKGEENNTKGHQYPYVKRYADTIKIISKSGGSILDFVKLNSYIYDNFRFASAYAGPKWTDASNSFLAILKALPEKYRPDSITKPLKPKQELEQPEQPTETKSLSGSDSSNGINPKNDIYDPDGLLMGDEEDAEETGTAEIPQNIEDTKSIGNYDLTPKERLGLFIAMDHTWGLSHNTGPTFNKLDSFNKLSPDSNGGWLAKALDKRTQDENLFRFINNSKPNQSDVSPQMIPIIKRVVYAYYGATNEDELYQHVARTTPVKVIPMHISDVVFRKIKSTPLIGLIAHSYKTKNVDFKSHYGHWCTLSFEIQKKDQPDNNPDQKTIFAFYFSDEGIVGKGRIQLLVSDDYNFKFTKNGIESDGSYISELSYFKLEESNLVANYQDLLDKTFKQIEKFNGVKIDPLKMDAVSKIPDITLDKLKDFINFNSDNTLNRVLKFASKYNDTTINPEGISIPSRQMMIQFIGAPKPKEVSDKTFGTIDAEDYFSGKRKKPQVEAEKAKIRFTFKADQTINKTMDFVDELDRDIRDVIISHVEKINENEKGVKDDTDKTFKNLKGNIIEAFSFGEVVISTYFDPKIPKPYNKIFFNYNSINNQQFDISGDKGYKIKIKLDPKRLTNPYTIDIVNVNSQSILNKEYRYSSSQEIRKDFTNIFKMMIEDIKDSEKEEFKNKLGSETFEDKIDNIMNSELTSYPNAVKNVIFNICKDGDQSKIPDNILLKLVDFFDEMFRQNQSTKLDKVSLTYNNDGLYLQLILNGKKDFKFVIHMTDKLDNFTFGEDENLIELNNIAKSKYAEVIVKIKDSLKNIIDIPIKIQDFLSNFNIPSTQKDIIKYLLYDKVNKNNFAIFAKYHNPIIRIINASISICHILTTTSVTRYNFHTSFDDKKATFKFYKLEKYNATLYEIDIIFDDKDFYNSKVIYGLEKNKSISYADIIASLKDGPNNEVFIKTIVKEIKNLGIKSTSELISKFETDASKHQLIEFLYNSVKQSLDSFEDVSDPEIYKEKIIGFCAVFSKICKGIDVKVTYNNIDVELDTDDKYLVVYLNATDTNDFTLYFSITPDNSGTPSKVGYSFNGVKNGETETYTTINPESIADNIIGVIKKSVKSKTVIQQIENPEIKNLIDNISKASKSDVRSSGLASFLEPTLQSFLNVIKPYKDRLTYDLKSNYNKTPQGVEVLSVVAPMKYNVNGKSGTVNAKITATYSKDNASLNKITLYDDPQDVKDNPNAIADMLRDYLAEKFLVKKPLKDSVNADVYNLVRAFLLKS